ncbi:hypothetical protein M426DRAFT_8851 [Hypoxylon sp. CI-4A]|nr:hypothetical protein M426DRAFT_8851 [Hypoxylon sp. CI-4A]
MSYASSSKANMQQAREGHFNPASPHSSSGAADSFKGTPDTRLTTFSPEDGSTRSSRAIGSLNSSVREAGPIKYELNAPQSVDRPGTLYRGNLNMDKDPFITTADSSRQKLSPTATSFFPLPSALGPRASASEPHIAGALSEEAGRNYGQALGRPLMQARMPHSSFAQVQDSMPRSDFTQAQTTVSRPDAAAAQDQLSTDSGLSRCLVISAKLGVKATAADVESYFAELQQKGIPFRGARQVRELGDRVFVRFTNIRDSCAVFSNLAMGGRDWSVSPADIQEASSLFTEPGMALLSISEGQLFVSVFLHVPVPLAISQDFLKQILRSEGDVYAFKLRPGVEGSILSGIVEYSDDETALRAASKLHSTVHNGYQICLGSVSEFEQNARQNGGIVLNRVATAHSDLADSFRQLSLGRPQSAMTSASGSLLGAPIRSTIAPNALPSQQPVQQPLGMMPMMYPGLPFNHQYMYGSIPRAHSAALIPSGNYSLASPAMSQHGALSQHSTLSQHSALSSELTTPRQFQHYGRPDGRRQNAMRVARSPYSSAPNHHNHVDVGRIQDGIDVRTTIMLRNIPNKVDQMLLKQIVDESSWGKYDFMYLRIDFANDCNVGYAFINFVDPLDIIDFVHARGNQRWNCFKSDKVAEISYATIQGKDCLVQKFRNSSVMLEAPHYRPKLFFTLNGPRPDMVGEEEPFPDPDNQSKMKRSVENAEHVGLFTPHAGQHFRDEQRRRRSQFDRGNPRLEDHDYNAAMYYQNYPPSQ